MEPFAAMIRAVLDEIDRSEKIHDGFNSSHEALGVALEEFEELKDAVRENSREGVMREALQLAAVSIRMALACFDRSYRERSGFDGQ